MQWRKLRSRAIRLIGYDFETSRLIVRFDGGVFYAYEEVEYDILQEFARSEIPGALINELLRYRRYSEKTQGYASLMTLLSHAQASGMRSIGRASQDSHPRSILRLSTEQIDDLSRYLDQDDDCEGNHTWVSIGHDGVGNPLVWHINEASGLIVPPHPGVLRETAGSRPPRVVKPKAAVLSKSAKVKPAAKPKVAAKKAKTKATKVRVA